MKLELLLQFILTSKNKNVYILFFFDGWITFPPVLNSEFNPKLRITHDSNQDSPIRETQRKPPMNAGWPL